MTRRSERELERDVAVLEGDEAAELSDPLWADLKDYYGGRLSTSEERLLEIPDARLRPRDARLVEE